MRSLTYSFAVTLLWLAPVLAATIPSFDLSTTPLKRSSCVGTISSLNDVPNAVKCTTININSFTVPAGHTFKLALQDYTTVNLLGNVAFGNVSWQGPLFQISGNFITFNGGGHAFDGGGPFYWDGQGSSGGVQKPAPMLNILMTGTFMNTKIINAPSRVFAIASNNPAVALKIAKIAIDNSQGDLPNAKSGGQAAGRNTDGFDVVGTNILIQNNIVKNQDDCVAINWGSKITVKGNQCIGGHGISLSLGSNAVVSDVVVQNNNIINSDQALRIKTRATATGSTVSNIRYSGNTGSGLKRFGVIIDQSYPATLATPGQGTIISNINFVGSTNSLAVLGSATPVAVNCGPGACTGKWDWISLKTSGGTSRFYRNPPAITY